MLLPPPSEKTIPTAWERLVAAWGGPWAYAAKVGRVVVEQGDGAVVIVPPGDAEKARGYAARGVLAEYANGDGTSPKPKVALWAVVARDASGVEVRTILTASAEATVSAARRQAQLGLDVEVLDATADNLRAILTRRLQEA